MPRIAWETGVALVGKGRREEAVNVLAPIAYNPHGGAMAAQARALMAGRTEAEAEAEGRRIDLEGDDEAIPPEPTEAAEQPDSKAENLPVGP